MSLASLLEELLHRFRKAAVPVDGYLCDPGDAREARDDAVGQARTDQCTGTEGTSVEPSVCSRNGAAFR